MTGLTKNLDVKFDLKSLETHRKMASKRKYGTLKFPCFSPERQDLQATQMVYKRPI